ncbi:MAG: TIGR02391 family protein [Microbacteriaceae bacterium]
MKSPKALEQLRSLRAEAETPEIQRSAQPSKTWQQNVRIVLASALGEDHHLVKQADKVRYTPGVAWSGMPDHLYTDAQRGGVSRLAGIIESAIYALELEGEPSAEVAFDDAAYDPELLAHVRKTIEAEEWDKLAAQVAIFIEDRVRKWSESTPTSIGKGLFASALSDDAELRLGQTKGEWEGWRMLGMGLAQAVANADRHRLQDREDLKRYAIGALGLGSLLLTQLRHEHADLIASRTL